MLQNNPLLNQLKKEIHAQKKREEGIVRYTDKGYGFLDIKAKKRFIIPSNCMHNLFNGDRIIATIEQHNNKTYARPESLVEVAETQYIGQIKIQNKQFYFTCTDSFGKNSFPLKINQTKHSLATLNDGDWIVAHLLAHPFQKKCAFPFELKYKFAETDNVFAYWYASLIKNNLPYQPVDELLEDNQSHPVEHVDLTDELFFTIDGDDTEDMDDAISISYNEANKTYRILIAIADPVEIFSEGSLIDQEACRRVMTLYLSGYTVPMLPLSLSSQRCSLQPHEKRLSLVCEMAVSADGELFLEETRFFNAWIKSQAKFSYEQVSDWLEQQGTWQPNESLAVALKQLEKITCSRVNWRKTHHLVFPDRHDYSLVINSKGELDQIVIVPKRIANKLVEEMMVLANISAAHLLQQHSQIALFNTHAGFDVKHLKSVITILNEYDILTTQDELVRPDMFCKIMLQVLERNDASLLYRIRRFFAYPEISFNAAPHYCMGLPAYATWTSPMRKYSDLINQRAIKNIINQTPAKKNNYPDLLEQFMRVRKSARLAEKEINDRLYFNYLKKHKQSSFTAEFIDINRSGAKVRLLENGLTAFIPLQNLHNIREEIKSVQDKGCIEIKNEVIYRLGEQIEVVIQQFNERNHTVLMKPKNSL